MDGTSTGTIGVDVSLVVASCVVETRGERATMAVEENVEKDECVMQQEDIQDVATVAQSLFDDMQFNFYDRLPPGYHMYYIFDERGQPIPTENIAAMSDLLADAEKRRIDRTIIRFRGMEVEISTVFLVMNHDHFFSQFPVLWETMTFTSDCARVDEWQDRYRFRDEAVEGHKAMVKRVLTELKRHPRSTRRMKVAQRRKMRMRR